MDIVYLGSGEFGIKCLNALAASKHNLQLIVTQQTQPAGRGRKPRPTPVADWAKKQSIDFIDVLFFTNNRQNNCPLLDK